MVLVKVFSNYRPVLKGSEFTLEVSTVPGIYDVVKLVLFGLNEPSPEVDHIPSPEVDVINPDKLATSPTSPLPPLTIK